MDIQIAGMEDIPVLEQYDRHISPRELETSVRLGRVYTAKERGELAGEPYELIFCKKL